jgi:hypothetical protein
VTERLEAQIAALQAELAAARGTCAAAMDAKRALFAALAPSAPATAGEGEG